jgi:MFS family permease
MTNTLAIRSGRRHQRAAPGGLTGAGLTTLLIGAALPPIDFMVVNVALPTIDRDLHASTATLELIVAGYGISYALLLVLGGRFGDAFGRRRLFLTGLAAFTLTSLVCGLAPDVETLIVARIAQGAAGALMLPQVLATIQATTTGTLRARAIGRFGATSGIAGLIGQVGGGLLLAANVAGTGWRPIFLINVPIGLTALVLAVRTVPATRSDRPARADLAGTVLLAATIAALLVPLTEGRALGWPAWLLALFAVVPVAAVAFYLVERRIERSGRLPLLPPSLLRLAGLRGGLLAAVPFFIGFGGFMFVYALAMQQGLGLGPFGAGLAISPLAVSFFVFSMLSPRLIARFGRRALPFGVAVQGLGIALMIPVVLFGWSHRAPLLLIVPLVVTGTGQAVGAMSIFRIVLAEVPADRAGAGSGILTTTQQTAIALGTALLGSLYATVAGSGGGVSTGAAHGMAAVLAAQLAACVLIAALGHRLPQPR